MYLQTFVHAPTNRVITIRTPFSKILFNEDKRQPVIKCFSLYLAGSNSVEEAVIHCGLKKKSDEQDLLERVNCTMYIPIEGLPISHIGRKPVLKQQDSILALSRPLRRSRLFGSHLEPPQLQQPQPPRRTREHSS